MVNKLTNLKGFGTGDPKPDGAVRKGRTCKYCGGGHSSADHSHSPSMNDSVRATAKKVADHKYSAESHNRKADALRNAKDKALSKKTK